MVAASDFASSYHFRNADRFVPEKPKGMHWRTYERLCRVHDAARARSLIGLTDFAKRIRKRVSWRFTVPFLLTRRAAF